MGAINAANVTIDATGNIRWVGAATGVNHTILEFIQFLMDKQDDEQAAAGDLLDITVDTPFNRSTDQIVTLNSPFNIDDTFATHLYDGSVAQIDPVYGGQTLYSGLRLIGPVVAGTEYMIIQNGRVLPAFWGTGINAEASPSLVFSRHLVKSKFAGSQIDNQNIQVLARELGDQYRRFPVTLGTGNSVAAIGNGADIFNANPDATIAAWTITNTEGFQDIDIDGTTVGDPEEYYSQWAIGTQTINDTYEYTKWITQRSHLADATGGTPTGTDFIVDNATNLGHGQSFISLGDVSEMLTEARFQAKIDSGDIADFTGLVYAELYSSDGAGSGASVPVAALGRSENILISALTTSYEEVIFKFNMHNPATGADQRTGLTLTASTEYFIIVRHEEGTATEWVELDGGVAQDATQNSAIWTGSWAASANDINLEVYTSPIIHGISGNIFQGINVDVGYDGEVTGVAENDIVVWGTKVTYNTLVLTFIEGEPITFKNGTTIVSGGHVLFDDGTDMIVALDSPSASVIVTTDTIEGLWSGATAICGTIADEEFSGGSGVVLAMDDNTGTGELYLQVLTGVNPVNDNTIYAEASKAAYVLATATITTRTVNPEFLGTSTGSNIIGAYGIGFDKDDVGSSDLFTSLDGVNTRQPPNNVLFTVSGIISGDRVLVGPRNGTALDRGQWLLDGALTTGAVTSVVVKTGTDTVNWPANKINWPATGKTGEVSALRIELDSGIYRNVDYESHDGASTFTILSTDFSGVNAAADGNNVFLAFIDVATASTSESFTGVHTAVDRDLFVRVRDGGGTPIKTFENVTAQFKSTPQTIAATRTEDY